MAARHKRKNQQSKAHREFISESEETLEGMRGGLADLMDQRVDPARDGEIDPDLINTIFRAAHSLKGLAGMFGLDSLGRLAHHLEDVLDGLRLGRNSPNSPAIDLLDEAVRLFASLLPQVGSDDFEENSVSPVDDLIARIEVALEDAVNVPDELAGLDLDPSLLRALTEYEEHRLRENLRRGRHLSLVDTTFEILSFEEGLAEISAAIKEVGEVVSTLPSPGEVPESQIRFSLLAATKISAEELAARLEFSHTSVRSISAPAAVEEAHPSEPDSASSRASEPPEAGLQAGSEPPEAGAASEMDSLRSISATVRVDIKKLDDLMNMVGELSIQRASILDIVQRLSREPSTARIGGELGRVHKLLDRKLNELQSGVLEVRMVPLRQVFEKLSRVVRRLQRDLGKDVAIDFSGSDTELDKLIVEQLVDPLMHVVRNAFDHAIETAEERRNVGKPERGEIFITASQRGNHVVIEVRDDGRGIDFDLVRRVAAERGLVPADAQMTEKETLDLLFEPGFSTRGSISSTSGRGVGMDVVRTNLVAMGGMVEISTTAGLGSCVTLTLPITLAIIQALIVGVENQRFAIPLNSVLETLSVDPGSIQTSEGRELLNLRGEALPLRRLSDEFRLTDTGAARDRQFVVVLGLGDRRTGLLVDTLEGQKDTVIKAIQGPIEQVRGIAGATEDGENGAILVIDVASILDDAARRRDAA